MIKAFQVESRIQFGYFRESLKTIRLAQGGTLVEAGGEPILFFSDAETGPRWVDLMFTALERETSGINPKAPERANRVLIYHRSIENTLGQVTRGRTGNVTVPSQWIHDEKAPFDPVYGIAGGQDNYQARRLFIKGTKLIDCYEYFVTEIVSPESIRSERVQIRASCAGGVKLEQPVSSSNDQDLTKAFTYSKATCLGALAFFIHTGIVCYKIFALFWRLKLLAYSRYLQGLFGVKVGGYWQALQTSALKSNGRIELE